ncbi:LOW QUALITY PROTEIN: hypothetical protein PanWU01x14_357450, partial [Parasponia andersonii]
YPTTSYFSLSRPYILRTQETSFLNRPVVALVDCLYYPSADFVFAPSGQAHEETNRVLASGSIAKHSTSFFWTGVKE